MANVRLQRYIGLARLAIGAVTPALDQMKYHQRTQEGERVSVVSERVSE